MEKKINLKPRLILLFGRICSGKSSYMKDKKRLVVSDIVRQLINSTDRTQLQNTMHLDEQIGNSICAYIRTAFDSWNFDELVVDGIRQVSIVHQVLENFQDAELIWLEVPTEERKRRYENRKDKKDIEPFEIADNKPIEIECQRIFDVFGNELTIINNF